MTGLKASTLLSAYVIARTTYNFSMAERDRRRVNVFWNKLIAKLEAQEKELSVLKRQVGVLQRVHHVTKRELSELQKTLRDAQLEQQGIIDQFYKERGEL